MNDQDKIENVIKGLEKALVLPWADYDNRIFVYGAIQDALIALLEAQEPVEPVFDAGDGKTIGQFLCGKCHAKIGFGHPHFCWYCGRAVKWE